MSGIPVGKNFTSKVEGEASLRFRCEFCDYASDVTVRAKGSSTQTAWLFLGQDTASERASTDAVTDMVSNARELVSLATCPSCFKYDEPLRRRVKLMAALTAVGMMVLGCGGAWLFRSEMFMLLALPVVGFLAAVQHYNARATTADEATGQLTFHQPPVRAKHPASLWKGPD